MDLDNYRPQILIVDDNRDNIFLLSNLLSNAFALRFALSGSEALLSAARFPPDLILLDVTLQDTEGYEICSQLRRTASLEHVPVIIMGTCSDSDLEAKCLTFGASDYLIKPIHTELASLRIHNHIERELLRRNLENERASMTTLLQSMQDSVLALNRERIITRCHIGGNKALFSQLTNCVGLHYQDVLVAEVTRTLDDVIDIVLCDGVLHQTECRVLSAGQACIILSITVALAGKLEPTNPASGLLIVVRDISCALQTEDEIRQLAFVDSLTHLSNRRLLMDRLTQVLHKNSRKPDQSAVIFLDLDRFKLINDTYGHERGDQMLISVASRLQHCVRASDTVARLGGDEFVILLVSLDPAPARAREEALTVANKVLKALCEPHQLGDFVYYITPSIGIKLFSGSQEVASELLTCADKAMYVAKQAGGNRVQFADDGRQNWPENGALATEVSGVG